MKGVYIHQWDVETAFLNSPMPDGKEIFIRVPPEFAVEGKPKFLKLKKCLYGQRCASAAWQKHLGGILREIGCTPMKEDPAVYVLKEGKEFIFIPTHVDDLFPVTNSHRLLNKVWDHLGSKLVMKDMGEAKNILGMKVEWDHEEGITKMSMPEYVKDLLEKFEMSDCKTKNTPASTRKVDQLTPEACDVSQEETVPSLRIQMQCFYHGLSIKEASKRQFRSNHKRNCLHPSSGTIAYN